MRVFSASWDFSQAVYDSPTYIFFKQILFMAAGVSVADGPNLGREYTEASRRIYPEAAKASGVRLIPFFLKGVAGDPALNQADGIHPTGEGYKVVVETVYPYVTAAIQERAKVKRTGG